MRMKRNINTFLRRKKGRSMNKSEQIYIVKDKKYKREAD